MQIEFYKYQGTGNDFIIADNRDGRYSGLDTGQIQQLCHRRYGIGADGFMLLNNAEGYDFEMKYYNADGNIGSMCGNGGRCIVQFAYDAVIKKTGYYFLAPDGPHEAGMEEKEVSLKMKDVDGIQKYKGDFIVDTGSPHYIKMVNDVRKENVYEHGKAIRHSADFDEAGINVNFVEVHDDDSLMVRTFERGVEDETFSCGTGVTAAAMVFYHNENGFNSVDIQTLGGKLNVRYRRELDGTYNSVWLKGPAALVFTGSIDI